MKNIKVTITITTDKERLSNFDLTTNDYNSYEQLCEALASETLERILEDD